MTIALNRPLAWQSASLQEQQMLQALQGNILKGHGRPETSNIFFALDPQKPLESRRALREIAVLHATSAHEQLIETTAFQKCGQAGKTFVAVLLAFSGYKALGLQSVAPSDEPQFTKGMQHPDNLVAVGDISTANWEAPFKKQIDGMILIGDMLRNQVRLKRDVIVKILQGCNATLIFEQPGSAIKDKHDNGIEHFGYVDGRSQPLMLVEDIEKESQTAGISRWDPAFPLSAALVNENAVDSQSTSFGSYFVFRKLEQNVRDFKRQEQALATALGLKDAEARERAGAQIVGRFEDGTPVTLSDEARGENPRNDFNYAGDAGARCPFQAHIRKVNPRGSMPGGGASERSRIMPRRGIPYEDKMRALHPSDLPGSTSVADFNKNVAADLPTDKVGLLFMAYNASLAAQFVFTQQSWANAPTFPINKAGVDPVIGQNGTPGSGPAWGKNWDDPTGPTQNFDFQGFVTMRGGEYFFAPSLNFLKSL